MRKDARIDTPADLKGKRIGVPEYQQTAALWTRGVLQHEFGVAPKDMEFWMERPPSRSHGGATGFKPPPGVTVNQIPADKSIGSMMLSGELQAVMFYLVDPNLIDRSTVDLHNHPDIKSLFPDPVGRRRPLLPQDRPLSDQPRHGDQAELAERHPWAITNILKAFQRANDARRPPAHRTRRILFRDRYAAGAGAGQAFAAPMHHAWRCRQPDRCLKPSRSIRWSRG